MVSPDAANGTPASARNAMPMTIERRNIFCSCCAVAGCVLTGMAFADGGPVDDFQQYRHGTQIGLARYI
jgi:hypothetical protein